MNNTIFCDDRVDDDRINRDKQTFQRPTHLTGRTLKAYGETRLRENDRNGTGEVAKV